MALNILYPMAILGLSDGSLNNKKIPISNSTEMGIFYFKVEPFAPNQGCISTANQPALTIGSLVANLSDLFLFETEIAHLKY